MKKLSKFGRSTLSLLLCLTMLLTTFCFFDIGSVISEAIISKGDHALTEAGTTSNTFAEYSINLPELVYIKPGGKDSQYFLNSSTDGSVSEPTSSTSVLSFACSTARSVTFSVALYDSTLSSTVSSNRITNIAFADGTYMSSDKSLSVPASSVNKTIKTVTLANAETAKEYIIQWTIVYTTASGSYTTYAYTGVKFPSLAQAGMTTRGYYYGTTGGATGNPAEQSAYSFLTGVDSVAGGNVGSKFMSTGASLTAPLVNFNSSIYPNSLSAPIDSNYFDPDGEGVLVAYAEHKNSPYFGQGSRIFHTVWDVPGDTSYIPKDMIPSANYFGGAPSTTADNYGYAAANITIDTSRYTDFSQVPNLSAGFVEFDSDGGEDQNYLHVIRNCSYVGWDASKYFRDNRTSGLDAGSMNTQATIWCPDVDRSDESNGKVFVRGPYKLSGNIYNAKNNLTKSTTGGSSQTIASYDYEKGVYTTYMRFEYSLRWNPWIGSSEYSSHIAAVRLNATLVDRRSARTYYHQFLNSGVNTDASNWDTINGYLKEYAKSLCVSTSSAGTITDPTSAISTAQAELKTEMKTSTPLSPPLYFYVPEAIYLVPQVNSWISQTRSQFQYFIQNDISDPANPTTKTTRDTTGTVYFKYPNASDSEFKLSFKWLDSSGKEMGSTSSTTASYYNSNSYINLGGSNRVSKSEYSFTLSSGVLDTTMTTAGYSPYLVSGDTGCYIEWTASYKDSVDGYYKTAVAYTYVYKPYVISTAAGATVRCTDGNDHDNSQLSWMSGFHEIAVDALKPTVGTKEQKAAYLRYTTVDKAYACMPFMSYDTGTISGDLNFPISGMGTSGNANVVSGNKPDYRLQSTAMKLAFASSTDSSSYFKYTGFGNNWAHDWMSSTMTASATLSSSTTTNKLTGSFFYWESGKDLTAAINTGGVGGLYIDTSRYSNLNQIPNLGVGMQMTDNRDTSNSDDGAWMIADATDIASSTYVNSQKNGDKMREEWKNVNYYIAGMGTPDNRNGDYDKQNLKYAGNWNRSILEGETKDYQIKTAQMNNQNDDWVTVIVYLKLRCYQADKFELRKAVKRAQNNFPNLGIYNSGAMSSYYYTGPTYTNFVDTYKSACRELTKVDGGTASSVATLVTNLNNYLDSLVTGTDLKVNCTAREYNLGLEKLADGKFKIIEIPGAKQYSLTYNARDNVYFAPDSYTGFTYAGSYELTNTTNTEITPSDCYGKTFSTLQTFLSESDYTSKAMSVSGTTATIASTTEKTTTVPKFDGNATSFEWVAAVNDTSLTMVNFYYLDRNTINFDPNDGSSKVNLLTEPMIYQSSNDYYTPATANTVNGVTVTYNPKTNVFTFNGKPTTDGHFFRFPIAGKLTAGTTYTYNIVYVGGSKTIPSGTNLTVSLDLYKKDGNTALKGNTSGDANEMVIEGTNNTASYSKSYTPDSYQAENGAYIGLYTYSENYSLSPSYNNYQVKLELVESGTANSTFSPNAKQAYYGRQLGTLPTPVRDNYEFLGWFTAPDGGERVTASDIMGTEDMTVYAHWAPDNKVVLLDNDFNFDDFVAKGSTAATTLNSFANSFKACASPGYQDALTDQTKPFTSTVFNESNGETALNISYDRSSIGDSGVTELFDTLKSTTYTASTAGEYTVSYEYRINDYYSRFYEENGNNEYDSVVIGFSTDSGYRYSGGEGVSYTENKSTTEGYEKVTLTRTLSANTNYFFTMTFYFCNEDGANELRADIDIKNIVVKDPNGNIVLSSNSLVCENGSASFDPDAREITLKPTAADCYTITYNSTAQYRSTLEAGKKYTLMMDYNASTNVRIRPFVFFYPSATSTPYKSTAATTVDVPAGTGTFAMQFTVPTDNYYQFRFGIDNYQGGSTIPGSVTFGNVSIQRTEIYADGAYNTDSRTYLGWVSKVTGPSSTSTSVYVNDLTSRYEKITSHYQDIGYQNAYTNLRVPTREGYNFVGWFDASGTQYTDASGVGTKVCTTDGVKLYSRWTVKSYTVTYDYKTNGGTSATKTTASVNYGAVVDLTPKATKSDWTFVGWNTDQNATTALTSLTMPAKDITLYAIYTKTITAKFYWINAADGKTVTETQTVTIFNAATSGTVTCSTTPADVTYDKREFEWIGWRTDTTAEAQTTKKDTSQSVSTDTNFYAVYSGTLTLSYNANKGTGAPSSQTATQYLNSTGTTGSVSYNKSTCTFTVSTTVPTYTGWTFDGWATTSTATSGKYGASPKTTEISVNANTTLYAIWNKAFTVNFYYYNNQVETQSVTIYNGASSVTVTSPTIADQTVGGITYTGRGWSTSNSATASVSVASGANVSVSGNANYYASYEVTRTATFYYCTEPTSTIKGSGAAQSSVTADAVSYMNYTGAVADSNYTVPTQVTSSHGNGVAENYIGVSAAKNNSSTVTPTTANTTFYAVYSESLTFYYYNGSAHTSSSLTRYMLSNGTSYNASMSGTVPTPSNIDSKTVWSGNWSYQNDSYNTGNFRTPTATGVNSLYAVYNKSVALIYNLNGGTSSAIANTTGTAHLISKNGGVNTFAVSLAITDTVPAKTDYTFLGWADTASATAPQYYAKHTFSLSADKTIYAVWLETATPDEKVNNKDVYSTEIDVVKGVTVTGFTDDDVTVQEITTKHKLYNSSENAAYQALCEAYTNALNTYKNSPSVDNAKALTTARNNLANAVAPKYNSSDRSYLDGKFTVEYASGVTDRPVTAGEHSVSELNLNHYTTANLDSTLSQLIASEKKTLASEQSTINTAVKTIAKNFVNKSLAKDTDPMYSVYENAQKAVEAKLAESGIKAINYVYTGKGNYTYYCYTNTTNPILILTVDDVVGNGRVCYPTRSKVEKTATVSGTVNSSAYSIGTTSVNNNEYSDYIAKGMGTSMTGGASYYSQKSVIKLTPTFTSGKNGSVSYQIKASDDSYNSASTEFGGNYATTSKLSSGKTSSAISTSTPDTNVTPVNTITIVIDYHNPGSSFDVTGDQVQNDKWLKQYHLFRSSGGASNWEFPRPQDYTNPNNGKAYDEYLVDDTTYGQNDFGSFTFTFKLGNSIDLTSKKVLADGNIGYLPTLNTKDPKEIVKAIKDGTISFSSMKACQYTGTRSYYKCLENGEYEKDENGKIKVYYDGTGYGFFQWPKANGWTFNYYPASGAYTYVHLVDRWGNAVDKVIEVGLQDAKDVATQSAALGYTILEDGGSGIDTLSLNSSSFEILTDENSTLENNVFRTAGNTVRISTGEANKAYTLTMTDKATNSSTATVKSDENGIVTLSVEDTAYESGVYTFMLNSVEVNLYDGAETDKYVLSVSGDEVDEGETAQITVITKGDVSKLRFTDESGNTSTVSSFVQNDDGTRTWTFSKARPAGEYTYKITVKVGYEWLDEGDTATLIFNERILDSGKVRSAEYDEKTGLYKVTFEGRATKVQFVSEDGMTRTYTRYAEAVKSIKTYDADGNEVNDTARTLDHEVWYIEARLYSGQNYTVVGKFEAGWNRAEDATSTVTGK